MGSWRAAAVVAAAGCHFAGSRAPVQPTPWPWLWKWLKQLRTGHALPGPVAGPIHLAMLWMEMFPLAPCRLLSARSKTPALLGKQRSKESHPQQLPLRLQSQCWWGLKVSEGNACPPSLSLQRAVVLPLQHMMASPLTMPGSWRVCAFRTITP